MKERLTGQSERSILQGYLGLSNWWFDYQIGFPTPDTSRLPEDFPRREP